jgi:hypothetical protein
VGLPKDLQTPPLRYLIRRLRAQLPSSAPVRIIRKPNVRCDGDHVLGVASYRFRKRGRKRRMVRCRITIDSRLSRAQQWEALIHEWAHVRDRGIRVKRPKDCHDSVWGKHFACAFRASLSDGWREKLKSRSAKRGRKT